MKSLKLFEAYGIESEYMIVNEKSLAVEHSVEFVLKTQNNNILSDEIEVGDVCWSNELVDHVIEIKCNGPQECLKKTELNFYESIKKINQILSAKNAHLMPTSMHPFMDPNKEMQLWPHGQKDIYKKYDEIFKCTGHGWSNLQSVHINLPFANEDEFERLHAAIRVVLPFISYMSASSPAYDGQFGAFPDNRLKFYEVNQLKVPSVTGKVIPEPLFNFSDYHDKLNELYKDISVYDPDKTLQHQWLNSRGAIVKFDVQAIEIRIMDIQESVYMDFALIHFWVAWIKALVSEDIMSLKNQKQLSTELLKSIYDAANSYQDSMIPTEYTSLFSKEVRGEYFGDWMRSLYKYLKPNIEPRYHLAIEYILTNGNLSKRIKQCSKEKLDLNVYKKLVQCLKDNSIYEL